MPMENDSRERLDSQCLRLALQRALMETDPVSNTTWFEQIIRAWIGKACAGSYPHLRELLIRLCDQASDPKNSSGSDHLSATRQDLLIKNLEHEDTRVRENVLLPVPTKPVPSAEVKGFSTQVSKRKRARQKAPEQK